MFTEYDATLVNREEFARTIAVIAALSMIAVMAAPLFSGGVPEVNGQSQAGYYLSDQATDNGAAKAAGTYLGGRAGQTAGSIGGAYAGVYAGAKYGGFTGAYVGGPVGAAAGGVIGGAAGAA